MPSTNPSIAVRVPPEMFQKIRELAQRDGRSMSNFIEFQLRRLLTGQLEPVFTTVQQVDIEEEIARSKRRPASKAAKHK
jgi:Arc/MetJ-type ribon-helix-helix transcriptional regulator